MASNAHRRAALLLVLLAPAAFAAAPAPDFDGRWGLPAFALPLVKPAPRPAPAPAPDPRQYPPAPSGAVSFNGITLPARAFSRVDRVPESLAAAIDATRSTLRLALYELTLPGVAGAIVRAKDRGVDVKLIYDQGHAVKGVFAVEGGVAEPGDESSGPSAEYKTLLDAGIETRLLKGASSFGIMHNKIAVFDGELVETGSFNWTTSADSSNFENAVFRDDGSLAALYAGYFDWMWGYAKPAGARADPTSVAKVGPAPTDPAPSLAFKGQTWPRVSFSPNGGTEARLADAISRCGKSLDVAIFSFYSQALADAVLAARERGVAVRVVADASQSRRSPQIAQMVKAGTTLRLSGGRAGKGVLHHKFLLLDGELLATGSFNLSENAEANNFENQLYSTDAGDLAGYQAEFEAVWAQAHEPARGELADAPPALAR